MGGQTYSIIRAHRDRDGEWEEIVESGLDWETAHTKAVEWSVRERFGNPTKTSWTRDLSVEGNLVGHDTRLLA